MLRRNWGWTSVYQCLKDAANKPAGAFGLRDRLAAVSRFLLVCLGGAIGTAARYLTSICAPALLGTTFPYGTLIVNSVGSFLIAFIMHVGGSTEVLSPNMRAMLTTGVMGGF